jgi:hypothetical protein
MVLDPGRDQPVVSGRVQLVRVLLLRVTSLRKTRAN